MKCVYTIRHISVAPGLGWKWWPKVKPQAIVHPNVIRFYPILLCLSEFIWRNDLDFLTFCKIVRFIHVKRYLNPCDKQLVIHNLWKRFLLTQTPFSGKVNTVRYNRVSRKKKLKKKKHGQQHARMQNCLYLNWVTHAHEDMDGTWMAHAWNMNMKQEKKTTTV